MIDDTGCISDIILGRGNLQTVSFLTESPHVPYSQILNTFVAVRGTVFSVGKMYNLCSSGFSGAGHPPALHISINSSGAPAKRI